MPKPQPLTDIEGEVRELTAADMKLLQNSKHALPGTLMKMFNVRGPQKTPTKEGITMRLSPEVVQHFRDAGEAASPGSTPRSRIDLTSRKTAGK